MVTEKVFAAGVPCWVDLISSDPQRVIPFYRDLLGWTVDVGQAGVLGEYTTFHSHGAAVAGCGAQMPGNPYGNRWTTYIGTDDAYATAAAVTAAGGRIMMPPTVIGDQGAMTVFVDPAGATVGAWEPNTRFGYQRFDEVGAPSWHETVTRDYAAAVDFYAAVFGWTYDVKGDTDEFRYSHARIGRRIVAGILDGTDYIPDNASSYWQHYVAVADTDDAVDAVVAMGGSVLRPAEVTPFGRLAYVADPLGAAFQVMTRPPR